MVKEKIREWWINYHGFLTEKGKGLSYVRLHALGLGVFDGFDFHGEGYRLDYWYEKHPDVEEKPHYYEKGYFWGRLTKYVLAIVVASYLGADHLLLN